MTSDCSIALKIAVKKVLHYYAAFKHPLKAVEVHFNCGEKCSEKDVMLVLNELLLEGRITSFGYYYSVSEKIKDWVLRRENGEERARKVLTSATRYGRFIALFPFVTFVGISGSLSKGYADENSDFDFFIITAKNRLWICRSILHFVKKVSFLFGLQHKFCMNYFIDEEYCEIEEKNIYTAIEISSLKPVSGQRHYRKFIRENQWTTSYLPNNYQPYFNSGKIHNTKFYLKSLLEWMISPIGNRMNKYLMNLTDNKWRKKWKRKGYPSEDYDLAFKTTLYHSKNHPSNYQKKTLENIETLKASLL